jgi:hypothetical protein
MARIDDKVAALATLSLAQLRAEWERLHKRSVPALPENLLRMALAYRLQEKARGALPAMIARELSRLAASGPGDSAPRPVSSVIRPGMRLMRSWNGRTITVLAVEKGFLFEDKHYASLTSIARAVTGARWSGPRFFGLTAHA